MVNYFSQWLLNRFRDGYALSRNFAMQSTDVHDNQHLNFQKIATWYEKYRIVNLNPKFNVFNFIYYY